MKVKFMNDSIWITKIEYQSNLKSKIVKAKKKRNFYSLFDNKNKHSDERQKDLIRLAIRNFYLRDEKEVCENHQ